MINEPTTSPSLAIRLFKQAERRGVDLDIPRPYALIAHDLLETMRSEMGGHQMWWTALGGWSWRVEVPYHLDTPLDIPTSGHGSFIECVVTLSEAAP